MKDKKDGFYMGLRQTDNNGNTNEVENTYGLARTALFGGIFAAGLYSTCWAAGTLIKHTVQTVSNKIQEFKAKKEEKESE